MIGQIIGNLLASFIAAIVPTLMMGELLLLDRIGFRIAYTSATAVIFFLFCFYGTEESNLVIRLTPRGEKIRRVVFNLILSFVGGMVFLAIAYFASLALPYSLRFSWGSTLRVVVSSVGTALFFLTKLKSK